MNSTPRQHPSVQRVNRAYVDVPPSPLTSAARRVSGNPLLVSSRELKENTPPQLVQTPISQPGGPSTLLKRKRSDYEQSQAVDTTPAKKAKPTAVPSGTALNAKQFKVADPAIIKTTTDEFPDGFAYCHQCSKKRDAKYTITCTVVFKSASSAGNSKERTCKGKYCKQCLKNKYNEDFNAHRNATIGFKCPRCRGICNCHKCRKAKASEDAGISRGTAKSTNPKVASEPKAKAKETVREKKPDPPTVKKPVVQKELPVLKWQRIPVSFTQNEADDRIFIREFFFRFGDCLDPSITKSHLEELEMIASQTKYGDDYDETMGWVNDSCLKALILGLLGLLAKDWEGNIGILIRTIVKNLRPAGVTLTKFWSNLSSLRDDVSKIVSPESTSTGKGEKPLSFPDPLPPPASAKMARSLRSARVSEDMINIAQSSQMIPIVVSLVHLAIETRTIREEIERGQKDNKDVLRYAKEATRIENERWEKERTSIEASAKDKAQKAEHRAKRTAHKDQITDIENALKVVKSTFAPRFVPLGTDKDGRVYYALSPGIVECEAALEYLKVASRDVAKKLKKKNGVLSIEERQELLDWSWFVAVWGTKPLVPGEPTGNHAKAEDNDDRTVPTWWGFWDPEEITKLAEYISISSGIEDEDEGSSDSQTPSSSSTISSSSNKRKQPRMEQLKKLVGGLKEYAVLLRWRSRQDKYALLKRA